MRFSPSLRRYILLGGLLLGAMGVFTFHSSGELAPWMRDVISSSAIESALYRLMDLPGLRVLYPRPPTESRRELASLMTKSPQDAELYALRAHVDEQSLDFPDAEADWKLYVAHAQDAGAANLQLADYYHRRLQAQEEIQALLTVAVLPPLASDAFTPASQQRSWQAFARMVNVANDQALPVQAKTSVYHAWIAHYPAEPALYAQLTELLIQQRLFEDAARAVTDYRKAFPQDMAFPVRASALIEYRQGSPERALAVYDSSFQPLWPDDLVRSYAGMLDATHMQRHMVEVARTRLLQNPDDLVAAVRISDYYQQQGHPETARKTIDEYRFHKEQRKAAWTAEELYTFATLLDRVANTAGAARYYFALYSASGSISSGEPVQQVALSRMAHLLLSSPEQDIHLGDGNLSMYRDIARVDSGPGYLNGILSLWLNATSPRQEFQEEEKRGVPYFHRAKAAELLALLDQKFPSAPARVELHAQLIHAYADYGDDAAVLRAGSEFLTQFPSSADRTSIAMLMADVYARSNNSTAEFALYDRMLGELATKSNGMPLTASAGPALRPASFQEESPETPQNVDDSNGDSPTPAEAVAGKAALASAMRLTVAAPAATATIEELTYAQLLDRYLGRLTTMKKLPEALAVLRHELDRSPNDPLLYERLAAFLQQNNFSAQQEEVCRRAIARFQNATWYDKLARFYIRHERADDYSSVTRQVVDTFRGTALDDYFKDASGGWPQISLQLNLYAHQRFPHDLVFTRNLMALYQSRPMADPAAWERLLREHWWEAEDLRGEFFETLSRTGRLDDEIAKLEQIVGASAKAEATPASARELADAQLWRSHFEVAAPLLSSLAEVYPADSEIGTEASSVYRSLAYIEPAQTEHAVAIEKNLLAANPGDLERLARIGDIYADTAENDATRLTSATPYWERMPQVHPGSPEGYLQAATIFWDYFQFNGALAQIAAARKQFHDATLYGYEAGAIDEGKRDLPQAVTEYVAAAIAGNSAANARLIEICNRPRTSQLVDAATAKALAPGPTLAVLNLRIGVLEAQERPAEIPALVNNAVDHAKSLDDVGRFAAIAQQRHLPASYQRALEREVAMATDPVQKIELQYALVTELASQKKVVPAQKIVDSIYQQNSKIAGVVRATTDFYWNNQQQKKAVDILVQASRDAYPELAHSYTLEAAEKSNASGAYAEARGLATPLLDADPYGVNSARCLAILADSYTRAGDDAGLRDVYTSRLALVKSAPLPPAMRRDQTALLRRGLIAALTRMKDYPGAVDQYIALLSAFPEDADVIQDAALYALRYGRQQQLVAFLQKTVSDSPRDARFAIVLGRVDTVFEDFPGAIDAYGKATAIRKDRSDVYEARATLEEHLQRFDDVCADYDRLYFLSYRDPQWMVKTAEARARQGKRPLAVKALRAAWIDGRPADAQNDFKVADQLEKWDLLEEARNFAEQGVQRMGNELLAAPEGHDGAAIYARILTRQRRPDEALKTLEAGLRAADASPSAPSVLLQQVAKEGTDAVTDDEWRRNRLAQRKQQAQASFQSALKQMGAVVVSYFTPEEKLAYARTLDTRRTAATPAMVVSTWIPAAAAAGLRDREALWRRQMLLSRTKLAAGQLADFNLLEKQRMESAERGLALEQYAASRPVRQRSDILAMAEDAWRDDANAAAEMAVLHRMNLQGGGREALRGRYFELLLRATPQSIVQQAASSSTAYADAAANFAIERARKPLALASVSARGDHRKPVWEEAATALTGLYFADKTPAIDHAFRDALDDGTIADRLAARTDTERHITGKVWFYYGMRYGVHRTITHVGDAEDYLASGLEGEPSAAASYIGLAQAYADASDTAAALREYDHALELEADAASIHRAKAVLLWASGRKEDAVEEWTQALAALKQSASSTVMPSEFWEDVPAIASDLHERGLSQRLHPQLDAVLRAYLTRNGAFRSAELLQAAAIASDSSTQAVDWILSLANAASDPKAVLAEIDHAAWLPKDQLGRLLRRELDLQTPAGNTTDSSANPPADTRQQLQTRLLRTLLDDKKNSEAQALYNSLSPEHKKAEAIEILHLVLVAHQGRITPLLADFRENPDTAVAPEVIAKAASQLRESGDVQSNRLLLEYVFQVKAARHALATADFLALAQARLDTNDTSEALSLLRRMTLVADDPYNGLDLAAKLLEDTGHSVEAAPFLTTLATSTPWNASYAFRLAKARMAVQDSNADNDVVPAVAGFSAVAHNESAPYLLRTQAASALKGKGDVSNLHSAELTLLASGRTISPLQVDQPYFLAARSASARTAPPAQRPGILRKALAVAPSDILRLNIFRAELALGHTERAAAAIQPLLDAPAGYIQQLDTGGDARASGDSSAEADNADDTAAESTDDARAQSARPAVTLPAVLATDTERVTFALAIASLSERMGRLEQAISYAQTAAFWNKDAQRDATLTRRLAALQAALQTQRDNNARRPIIQESLDQAVVVRPRLLQESKSGDRAKERP